jgi:RNA polymerase sigma factor (sigma-70 family)
MIERGTRRGLKHPGPDPDEDLLIRVGRGEPAAARALVARKLPRLLSLARRMLGDQGEAEDVAQEVFLRTWRQAPTWRTGEARLDSWMHRVALNLCYDRLRRRREDPMAEPPEQVDPGVAADRGLIRRQTGDAVASAVARLPARQRTAIVLCYYQELSNIEAAALMEVSVEAMESLLSRARRALRMALADEAVQDG